MEDGREGRRRPICLLNIRKSGIFLQGTYGAMVSGPSGAVRDFRGVYAIFEGGGAKGITHIGALKALEQENLALVGVAGSSAGAIIAALAAVGYTADELFSPDGADDILKRFGTNPVGLIGKASWRRLTRFRRYFVALLLLFAGAMVAGLACLILLPSWSVAPFAVAGFAALGLFYFLWPLLTRRGMLLSDRMREQLDALLLAKLKQHYKAIGQAPPKGAVRFEDIDPVMVPQCCRLKIVVTDARAGQLVMFDHNTSNVVVADAVAASAAIPLIFCSPEVRGARDDGSPVYVDGGLVSNLPAWSFRTEKRALERRQDSARIPIFAFTLAGGLAPSDEAPRRRGLISFIVDVIRTGIFGSQKIVQEFVPDLEVIELCSPLGTLSFDCTREEARLAYQAGLDSASASLKRRHLIEQVTSRALETTLESVRQWIGPRGRGRVPRLRMSLVDPVDGKGTAFRVVASADMAEDADDRLEFDLDNDMAPRAYKEQRATYSVVKEVGASALRMTKYERAMLSPTLASVICIPVYATEVSGRALNRPRPQRILCLDSSDALRKEFEDHTFMALLTTASAKLSRTLIEQLVEERVK